MIVTTSPFAASAPALLARGYSPVPIGVAGGRDWNPSGKEPGRLDINRNGEPEWYRLKGWNAFCKRQPHILTVNFWSTWPDACVGVACGYGGLVAVDIDDEGLVEPLLDVLPHILVAKRGRKGWTAFYRATDPFPSKNYRTTDGRGLLDFLSDGKQTVLPPSIHPDTGKPYEWVTERTLLNTSIDELPQFTSEHRGAMEDVLRAHGWDAPKPAQARPRVAKSAAEPDGRIWLDDVNATALAKLDAWVPMAGFTGLQQGGEGYRAIATWRTSGSGRSEAKRGANLSFHPTGIEDFGTGEKYTPAKVVSKLHGVPYLAAMTWLREQLGMPDAKLILLNANRNKLAPTYPGNGRPLADATKELSDVLSQFEAEMKEQRIYRNDTRLEPALIRRQPPFWLVRIDTAGGKTHAATEWTREWRRRGWRPIYVTPRIELADAAARRIAGPNVVVRVYRGRDQRDPNDADGKAMCPNPEAAQAAIDLGISVRPAVCARDGVRCEFFDVCGYERQMLATPDVWVVTPNMLLRERPDHIYEPDGLVFDEAFHENANGAPVSIDACELERAALDNVFSDGEIDFLTTIRARLQSVIKNNGAGHLSRDVLETNEITTRAALRASVLEQRPVSSNVLEPRMNAVLRKGAVKRRGARNRLLRNLGVLLEQMALFLESNHAHCGRILVGDGCITVTPLLPIHPSWLAPAVVLDATMTTADIIDAAAFGDRVPGTASPIISKADIEITWPDHVRVRQILEAPITMGGLGVGEQAEVRPMNEAKITRYIMKRAAEAHPGRVGVVSYKGFRERFEAKYPGLVDWMHFNAVAGLNDFEKVEGLIVIGRIWNSPATIEAEASVFAGYPIPPQGEFYRQYIGGIRMTSGSALPGIVDCHPDPFAEAIRWGRTEGGLMQALGRLRGPRRDEPCFLDIIGDVILPVTVDEVVQFAEVAPKAEADMMPYGVALTNVSDAMRAFGITEHAARGVGELSNEIYTYRDHRLLPVRKFQYKKAGAGQKDCTGYALADLIGHGESELREWLTDKLGPLASLNVTRVRTKDSPFGRKVLAKAWRGTEDWFASAQSEMQSAGKNIEDAD